MHGTVEHYIYFKSYDHHDHFPEVNVFFERDSYPAPESGGPVTVCVKKEGEIAESFTVQVATSNLSPIEAEGKVSHNYYITLVLRILNSIIKLNACIEITDQHDF